jgi:hypothetical protein
MEEYLSNPVDKWENILVVLNLIIASTVEKYTFRMGATQIKLDQQTLQSYFE